MIYFQWHFICSSAGWFLPSGTLFDSRCMIHSQWHFIRIPAVSFIPSGTLRTKSNAKYSTHFLLPGVTKGFKRNIAVVTRLLGREFLLKFRQIPWWIYDGVYISSKAALISWSRTLPKTNIIPGQHQEFLPLF